MSFKLIILAEFISLTNFLSHVSLSKFTVSVFNKNDNLLCNLGKRIANCEKTGERATLARSFSRMSTEF